MVAENHLEKVLSKLAALEVKGPCIFLSLETSSKHYYTFSEGIYLEIQFGSEGVPLKQIH